MINPYMNSYNNTPMDQDQTAGYNRKFRTANDFDPKTKSILDASEKQFLQYVIDMHGVLTGDQIDLTKFSDIVTALEHMHKVQEHEYYNTLARPEKTRGAKIPTQIPIPSSSFQLKQSFYVTTNALGNASVIINPFYLAATGTGSSTIFLNNHVSLDGTSSNANFNAYSGAQSIPPVYNQYRLVSASVVAKYVGRLDIVQGLIGGAIIFDQNITPTVIAGGNANLAKYGDYNLAQDAFFQQENYSLQGIRELYFPLDSTWEQYQPLGTSKNGFGFLLYVLGAPPSQASYKVDLFFNMECLPDVAFLNYIPTTISPSSTVGKEEAIRAIQEEPITKESEVKNTKVAGGNFFDTIINTLGSIIPKIPALIGML